MAPWVEIRLWRTLGARRSPYLPVLRPLEALVLDRDPRPPHSGTAAMMTRRHRVIPIPRRMEVVMTPPKVVGVVGTPTEDPVIGVPAVRKATLRLIPRKCACFFAELFLARCWHDG